MVTTPKSGLAERAYIAIREEILRGQLRPGTPLSRRRLAREFGMSVIPVTDASDWRERRSPPADARATLA